MGVRTFNHAATSRRETATNPPVLSSQRNVFTRSKSQGQGPLYGQLSYATKARRVEKRVIYYIVGDSINDEDRYVVPVGGCGSGCSGDVGAVLDPAIVVGADVPGMCSCGSALMHKVL